MIRNVKNVQNMGFWRILGILMAILSLYPHICYLFGILGTKGVLWKWFSDFWSPSGWSGMSRMSKTLGFWRILSVLMGILSFYPYLWYPFWILGTIGVQWKWFLDFLSITIMLIYWWAQPKNKNKLCWDCPNFILIHQSIDQLLVTFLLSPKTRTRQAWLRPGEVRWGQARTWHARPGYVKIIFWESKIDFGGRKTNVGG